MSTNDPARLSSSRRTFLTAGAAAVATSGATAAVAAAIPVDPDPIFPLIEAERVAWQAFDDSVRAQSRLEDAWHSSECCREPRAQIGTYTSFYDTEFNPIPQEKRIEQPIYAHSALEIDDECDRELKWDRRQPDGEKENAERRASLHKRLVDDAAAIEDAGAAFGVNEAEAKVEAASAAAHTALHALSAGSPTTAAGLLAMLDVCWQRSEDHIMEPVQTAIAGAFAAVRGFLNGRA